MAYLKKTNTVTVPADIGRKQLENDVPRIADGWVIRGPNGEQALDGFETRQLEQGKLASAVDSDQARQNYSQDFFKKCEAVLGGMRTLISLLQYFTRMGLGKTRRQRTGII